MCYVSPVHSGGSKYLPEHCRLASLTSHLIKVFDSVFKKYIFKHFPNNNYTNEGQNGLISATNSVISSLLIHKGK